MRESDASLDGATKGAMGELSEADVRRGYKALGNTHEETFVVGRREDSDGTTYVGNPWSRGGFLTRPRGFER